MIDEIELKRHAILGLQRRRDELNRQILELEAEVHPRLVIEAVDEVIESQFKGRRGGVWTPERRRAASERMRQNWALSKSHGKGQLTRVSRLRKAGG